MRADDVMLKPSVLLLKVCRCRPASGSSTWHTLYQNLQVTGFGNYGDRWSPDIWDVGAIKSESFCGGEINVVASKGDYSGLLISKCLAALRLVLRLLLSSGRSWRPLRPFDSKRL